MNSLISLRNVTKVYPGAAGGVPAVAGISLDIEAGSFVAMIGQSGCGKSTLLSLISGVDRPTTGEVIVDGTAVHSLSERTMSSWRGNTVGIVFQFFQLLPTLSAVENVMLPMDFCNAWAPAERRPRAESLLERLGVADQARRLPSTLSGGQQQRVAIARALANSPAVLLADEPTGNLDSRTSAGILDLFGQLVADGQTIVMVTHAPEAASRATRVVELADGLIVRSTDAVVAHA
jgi:putative ABC transport system ATP-binding protein